MTGYEKIKGLWLNATESDKVDAIVESLLLNGWVGAPILYFDDMGLVTGSHRLAALKQLDAMYDDADKETQAKIVNILNADVALEVSEIINAWCEENECSFDRLPFDSLSQVFKGTHIEQYKKEISEW